ncbi:MAG TPA: hypothetical protein VH741_08415, partial [Candidatus Limnocylindrales bacterium]
AAYTIALAAESAVGRPNYAIAAALRGAADTLRAARPINRPLFGAIDRLLHAAETATEPASAARAEAELVAMEAALDHAAVGQRGAELLAARSDVAGDPLQLLFIGDQGPLAGGMVGPGFALLQGLAALGRTAHAWLADGAPLAEGRRAAWQLDQLDVPHTRIPDAAIGWLLANRRIDALLLRAEWICANGDAVAALGARAAARLAREAGVPAYVVAPASVSDPTTPDAAGIAGDLLMPHAPQSGARLDPAADIVPGSLVSGAISASAG